MSRSAALVCLASLLGCAAWVALAADPKAEHEAMRKEHAAAHREHDEMLKQVGKWKIEHRKALAVLAQLQAAILEHEAELEELAEHAREHEDHILHHDEEFHEHEKSGDAKGHQELAASHKKMLAEHEKIKKSLGQFKDDHDALIQSLQALGAKLKSQK